MVASLTTEAGVPFTQVSRVARPLVLCVLMAASAEIVAADAGDQNERTGSTPLSVVEAQMRALGEWDTDPEAASRVFAWASPANRAVTGPLDRFRQMVEAAPYDKLLSNEGWMAGRTIRAESVAAILVTLVDDRGKLHAFRFYLSQADGKPDGDWRTDAVIAQPLPGQSAPPRDAI